MTMMLAVSLLYVCSVSLPIIVCLVHSYISIDCRLVARLVTMMATA
jgi:hypothetical protein